MRNRRFLSASDGQEGDAINLTPLLDVVFVVLIMFILIAPMLEMDRIELASSNSEKKKEAKLAQENHPLLIYVRNDNTIWMNAKMVTLQELGEKLKIIAKQNPQQVPQLFHDKKAYFGTYQSIKNLIESCGFEELDVILQPN